MKNFIILMLTLCIASTAAFAGAFKADARTKRIPAGTVFELEFLQPVSTFSGCEGDSFVATLKNELSSDTNNIYFDGSLYKNLGYGEAVKKNYERGVEITKNATNYGMSAGESAPGIQYLTAPICAVGGFIGGVGYWVGDSVADMFRKGQDVYINKGDVLSVKLLNPIDIPVY